MGKKTLLCCSSTETRGPKKKTLKKTLVRYCIIYNTTDFCCAKKKNHTRTKNAIQEIEAATRFLEHTTKIHIHPHSVRALP